MCPMVLSPSPSPPPLSSASDSTRGTQSRRRNRREPATSTSTSVATEEEERVDVPRTKDSPRFPLRLLSTCLFLCRLLRGIGFLVLFLPLVVVVNLIQCVTIPFRVCLPEPIQRLHCALAGALWSMTLWYVQYVGGLRVIMSGDMPKKVDLAQDDPESAILVSNHRSFTDWLVLFRYAYDAGALSFVKFFAKRMVQHIPLFGWGMKMLGFIFIDRNWERDEKTIAEAFRSLRRSRTPMWLVLFLEGHRFSKRSRDINQAYAREHNLPVYQHVLNPRTKGFAATIEGLGDLIPAVYDFTISELPGTRIPNLWDLLIGGREYPVYLHAERYAIEKVATFPGGVSSFCNKSFASKDERLQKLEKCGTWNNLD